MSLKDALLKHKKQLDEITQASLKEKQEGQLKKMLEEQQRILDVNQQTLEVASSVEKKEKLGWFTESMLTTGGVGYIEVEGDNGKMRKVRVSLTNDNNDIVLSYHCRIADGRRFSVSAKSYKDAKEIVDMLWGDGLYSISGSKI